MTQGITLRDAAKLAGVTYPYLCTLHRSEGDFPQPIKPGRPALWDRDQLVAWAEAYNARKAKGRIPPKPRWTLILAAHASGVLSEQLIQQIARRCGQPDLADLLRRHAKRPMGRPKKSLDRRRAIETAAAYAVLNGRTEAACEAAAAEYGVNFNEVWRIVRKEKLPAKNLLGKTESDSRSTDSGS